MTRCTRADWLGLGVDVRASESVRVGVEVLLRRLAREVSDLHRQERDADDRAMAYLYWTATNRIAASLELIG